MTQYKGGQIRRPGMGRVGKVIEVVRTVAANAPKVYEVAKKGVEIAGKIGKLRSAAKKGAAKTTNVAQSRLVTPAAGTRSTNRDAAPISLAIKFNGPSYSWESCTFQGMQGLRMKCCFIGASVEQNTTTAQRGALRSIQLAGVVGDTSGISSSILPCADYVGSTLNPRITTVGTPLYAMASAFRKYRLVGFRVKYEAEAPTTDRGGLALACSSDAADLTLTNTGVTAIQASQFSTSLLTSVWDDAVLDCTAALDKSLKNMNPLAAPRNVLYYDMASPCSLVAVYDQALAANTVSGKLIFEQVWEFYGVGPIPGGFALSMARNALKEERAAKARALEYEKGSEAQRLKDEAEERKIDGSLEEEYLSIFHEEPLKSVPASDPKVAVPPTARSNALAKHMLL